jgi:hypothetical protein
MLGLNEAVRVGALNFFSHLQHYYMEEYFIIEPGSIPTKEALIAC